MRGETRSYAQHTLLVWADCHVRLNTYGGNPPILAIDAGPITINMSIMRRTADQSAVDFARALVREVQAFAAEVERLRAEHATPDTTDTPDLAA